VTDQVYRMHTWDQTPQTGSLTRNRNRVSESCESIRATPSSLIALYCDDTSPVAFGAATVRRRR